MVAIRDAVAPAPAFGVPVVVSGGQAFAQAPKHVLLAPLSFSNRYSVRPCASTRILPSLVARTPTTALWACLAADVVVALGPALTLLL